MQFDLIIFDCDGTLVDSEYLNIKAIIDFVSDQGVEGYDVEYGLTHFSGMRFSAIMNKIEQEVGRELIKDSAPFLQKVRDLAPTYMKKINGVDEVIELSQNLAQTCVVSNGERTNVLLSIEFAGLSAYFGEDAVFSGAMSPNPKPAPDLFLLASDKYGISPAQCLVIEDSQTGVRAAKAAGMTCWGFSGAHHDPKKQNEILLQTGADKCFASMADIHAALTDH